MLKQPPDCFRACWLGCGSLPGWCSWSVNTIIYQQPSHHSRASLILLLLLLLLSLLRCCIPACVLHSSSFTRIQPSSHASLALRVLLIKSRRSNTHHSPPQNCWSPTALARATPKKKRPTFCSASVLAHHPSAHPLLRYPPPSASSISRVTAFITAT